MRMSITILGLGNIREWDLAKLVAQLLYAMCKWTSEKTRLGTACMLGVAGNSYVQGAQSARTTSKGLDTLFASTGLLVRAEGMECEAFQQLYDHTGAAQLLRIKRT